MTIRLGIIGVGNMGTSHCRQIQDIPTIELTAVCDVIKARADKQADKYGCKAFYSAEALIASDLCDSVLVSTPHFDHTTIGIQALKNKLHLLVEKPISAHKADCERLINAHTNSGLVFAAMFNQRTNGFYRKIRDMMQDGTLGEVRRFSWTITDWFRTQSYYDSGGWRATWGGEGGGVLLNQCPHQLDLMHWLFGMPERIHAFCDFGKFHDIEVEDSVTARLNYANGSEGTFITTTGEAPGVNRLEIAAEKGLLVYDTAARQIQFSRNDVSTSDAIANNAPFAKPKTERLVIDDLSEGGQHLSILKNFASAILEKKPLISPAEEGIHSVELANAMILSGALGKAVELPLSGRRYENQLKKWIKTSRYQPDQAGDEQADVEDISNTF